MRETNRPPALVLGTGITGLGTIRVLGQAGILTFSGPGPYGIERFSRWFTPAPFKDSRSDPAPLEEYLGGLSLDGAVLIPCSDELVLQAANLKGDTKGRFPSFLPPPSSLELLIDKGGFAEVLIAENIPHPVTTVVDDPRALRSLLREYSNVPFIKPRFSHKLQKELGIKALRPKSSEELLAKSQDLIDRGIEVIVQEYVPGPSSNHYFLDGFVGPKGRTSALFARQRLRMYPPDFGNSCLMVSIHPSAMGRAPEDLTRLLASLNYRGIFSAEFKKDERDGVFRILEINPRPWWYIEFAARCGADVATMAYQAALGQPVDSVASYDIGKILVHPYYDFFACFSPGVSFHKAAGEFMTSLVGSQQPVFRWGDPWPGVISSFDTMRGFLSRRVGRGLIRGEPPSTPDGSS